MPNENPHLHELYPSLRGGKREARDLRAVLLESVRQKAHHSIETQQIFFEENGQRMVDTARAIADMFGRNGRLFTMGNGGSSCDAAHVSVEFLHPVTAGRPALTAVNLTADVAMMTAVGNDVGFKHVFVRQLVAQARAGDGLIGISTSGNSENLLAAFAKAKELQLLTVALVGMDGGKMATSVHVDHCLTVGTDSIHRIQETHVTIYHILWDLVHTLLADERGGLGRGAQP